MAGEGGVPWETSHKNPNTEDSFVPYQINQPMKRKKKKQPIARLIGQLRRVILLPNISVRQNSPSSGVAKVK